MDLAAMALKPAVLQPGSMQIINDDATIGHCGGDNLIVESM